MELKDNHFRTFMYKDEVYFIPQNLKIQNKHINLCRHALNDNSAEFYENIAGCNTGYFLSIECSNCLAGISNQEACKAYQRFVKLGKIKEIRDQKTKR